jgi:ribosomal 50S subunit-recycling heat shock protein
MRLDKYLKVSRVIKRRTVANDACDADKVVVNGKTARASYEVKIGDIVELNAGKNRVKFRILKIAETVRKDDASGLFEIVE